VDVLSPRPEGTGPRTPRRSRTGGAATAGGGPATLASASATDLVRLRAAAGVDLGDPERLTPRTRRAVSVATEVGAPLLDALDGAVAAEDDARRAARAVAVASAQTRAVAGGLLLAPVVLVPGLGRLVGADLLAFYTTPLGLGVGAVGLALLLAGGLVVAGLVRRVGRATTGAAGPWLAAAVAGVAAGGLVHPLAAVPTVGALLVRARRRRAALPAAPGVDEAADLVATALAGGVPPGEALRLAARELPEHASELRRLALELELGIEPDPMGEPGPATAARPDAVARPDAAARPEAGLTRLRLVLATATSVGAAAAPAARRLARDLRADDLARVLAAAERLPAQLTFPTALCLLPATLLLVGAPMVHAGLAAAAT
jgi:Flp pilus assembly protein TadB